MIDVDLRDLAATRELGNRLGSRLFAGSVVALIGQPGAGKTNLSRAIAEGVGLADGGAVTSPTFVLLQEYEGGRLPIYHFDVYRLRGEADFEELGPQEYLSGGGVCLIEWADRIPHTLPADHLRVELTITGPSSRSARLQATGPLHAAVIDEAQ